MATNSDVRAVVRLVTKAGYSVEEAAKVVAVISKNNYYADMLADAYYEESGASDE